VPVLLAFSLLLIPSRITAEPFRFPFEVTVAQTSGPTEVVFGSRIATDEIISGMWTFERSLKDKTPHPQVGNYDDPHAMLVLRSATNSVEVTGRAGITVHNGDETADRFDAIMFVDLPGFTRFGFSTNFSGFPSVFSSDAIPSLTALSRMTGAGAFGAARIGFQEPCDQCPEMHFQGPARFIRSPEPVPEPGTLFLFTTIAATVAHRVWQQHRRRGDKRVHG